MAARGKPHMCCLPCSALFRAGVGDGSGVKKEKKLKNNGS